MLLENTVSKGVQQIKPWSHLSFQCFLHIMLAVHGTIIPINVSKQLENQYDMQPYCDESSEFLTRSKGNSNFVAENNFCEVKK